MKKILFIVLATLMVLPAMGRRYPFVRVEKNEVQFPAGDSPDFRRFLRKTDSLVLYGTGSVRVLHVGGSHVQGGTWSGRLRNHFLALRYGMDGGRGLVFPFAAAGTNTPATYNTSSTAGWEYTRCLSPDWDLGLVGVGIRGNDTTARATIDLLPREVHVMQQRFAFNRVALLGYGDREPVLLLSKKDTLWGWQDGPLWRFNMPCYTDWVQIGLSAQSSGSYTLEGVYLDKSTGGFTYSEAGVNGASTTSWLKCDHWERDVKLVMPDLVIFSIGINDIQGTDFNSDRFKSNYKELIKMVRKANPHCAILFTGINDSVLRRGRVNPHTEEVERIFAELAREYKAAFWDMYSIMGGYGSMAVWKEAGLSQGDQVHFTADGYRLLGDLMFDAIMNCSR
ncbi:MAG: hypothetical protein J6W94_01650 [Bacteroidales bacterium]|nr:hypothetical protein [Bacteroidales bacterium]